MAETNGNGNGGYYLSRIISVTSAIGLFISIVYAITAPMKQRIEVLEEQAKKSVDERVAIRSELAKIQVMFTEVETQFRASKELLIEKEKFSISQRTDLRERIDELEKKIYKK